MSDQDRTLSAPLPGLRLHARALLAITIVWHPQRERIGAQHIAAEADGDIALARYAPLFWRPDGDGLPLGHGGVSRAPLRLVRDAADGVTVFLPASRMPVELNGVAMDHTAHLDAAQLTRGQILTLGRVIILCVHWMGSLPKHHRVPGLVGVGSAAMTMREHIELVAHTDTPVLLLGETGTGKEIAARAIHALSARGGAGLVTVNMAALNESLALADLFGAAKGAYTGAQAARLGWFGEADDATIFLDEIGSAPASVQPMLLRVLDRGDYRPLGAPRDRRSTARLIAATDQNLDAAGFNQALLRRLEGFVIQLPPLRARREDIGVLVAHVLESQGWTGELPLELVVAFAIYDWPGNIRQLAHATRGAVLQLRNGMVPQLHQLIRPGPHLSSAQTPAAPPAPRRQKPSDLSDQQVLDAMIQYCWTIRTAAQSLGISRPSMYKLLTCHAQIRPAQAIPSDEIEHAMASCGGDVARCAAMLRTPVEPLRRHVRRLQAGAVIQAAKKHGAV